jgi:hypothetical protein
MLLRRAQQKRHLPAVTLPHRNRIKSPLDYQPEPRIKGAPPGRIQQVRKVSDSPFPLDSPYFGDKEDINQSFAALAKSNNLDQIIIATDDGLVLASSGGSDPASEAARYTEMAILDPLFETPGVTTFRLNHKGSGLVGIIKTGKKIPEETLERIAIDTKAILKWWV